MKVNKKVINCLIIEKWKEWEVKYGMRGSKPVWNLKAQKRTVDCIFCGKHEVEKTPDSGFFKWGVLPLALDVEGKAPEVCPKCLNKIGKHVTTRAPRVKRCSRCEITQKEKIFGVGFPGWVSLSTLVSLRGGVPPAVCPNCYLELGYILGPKFIRGTWTALSYPEDSLLTSTKMTQNQANFTAVAEGQASAPTLSGAIETKKGALVKKIDSGDATHTIVDDAAKVYRAVYNDLAELMPYSERSEPGDVLIWKDGKVCPSVKANDKRVIGVHSDSFGLCFGMDDYKDTQEATEAGFVPVGLVGRLKIRTVGPVFVGDLIMSSNTKGVAMRGNAVGAIVAKSLEKLYPAEEKRIDAILALR